MSALQKISSIANSESRDIELLLEAEFKKYFKKTPPQTITAEFRQLSGSVENQIYILNLALKVIEELDVEPVQAYGLLEAVRPVIYEKFKILTSRFIGKTLLSKTKANEMFFNAMDLYAKLTATYDSVIEEAKHFGDSQAFIMGSAIHRAMSDKVKLIQSYMLLYMDIPDQIWKHLNSLYTTADEFNIHNQVISDTMLLAEYQLSIKQLYSYALILSTCDLKNLHTTDIKSVTELLKSLIKTVQLKPRVFSENCIYMDPTLLLTPERFHEGISQTSDKSFSFDFKGLEKPFTKKYHTQIVVDGERNTVSPQVLDRIYQQWLTPFVRIEDRSLEKRVILARPGFALNWRDNGLSNENSTLDIDVPARDYRSLKMDLSPSLSELQFTRLSPIDKNCAGIYQPELIDSSQHGYCLAWSNAAAQFIQVGELLVINDVQQSMQFLCQVLWVKCTSKEVLKTGLCILTSTIIPVLVKPVKSAWLSSDKIVKAFLTATDLGGKQNYNLIAEKLAITTGQVVTLFQGDLIHDAQILEQHSINQNYQSFSIGFYE